MQALLDLLKRCAENHTFDTGDPDNRTVLDQLFCAYQDSHETDPPEIKDGFKELDTYLRHGICAAAFVRHTNTKPSSTDSTTACS